MTNGHSAVADIVTAQRGRSVWFTIGILFLAWVLAYIDRYVMTLLVPAMKQDLALSDTEIGIIQGFAFSLFFAIAGLPIGRLVDRFNRRNIIAAGLACWSLMTIMCGLADGFWSLFAARVGVGVGEACLAPASMSLVADLVARNRRGRATSILAAGSTVGGASANYLGGLLLAWLGTTSLLLPVIGHLADWQIVFVLVGLPGLVIVPLVLMIPEPERREGGATEGASAASFRRYAIGHRSTFIPVYVVLASNFIAGTAVSLWGPIILMRAHDLSPAEVGMLVGTILIVVGPLATLSGGYLSDLMAGRSPRDGRARFVLFLLPPLILSILALSIPNLLVLTIVGLIGVKAVTNMLAAVSYVVLQDVTPNEMRGQAVAVHVALSNIVGLGVGSLMVGVVTDYVFADEAMVRASVTVVALSAAVTGFICAATMVAPYRRLREDLEERQRTARPEEGALHP